MLTGLTKLGRRGRCVPASIEACYSLCSHDTRLWGAASVCGECMQHVSKMLRFRPLRPVHKPASISSCNESLHCRSIAVRHDHTPMCMQARCMAYTVAVSSMRVSSVMQQAEAYVDANRR